jgi:hypothetical protein
LAKASKAAASSKPREKLERIANYSKDQAANKDSAKGGGQALFRQDTSYTHALITLPAITPRGFICPSKC